MVNSTSTAEDKKNLWELLMELMKAFKRMIENKGKIPILENEIKNLEETVNDMGWVSVASYEQLEYLTKEMEALNEKITIAKEHEDYLKNNASMIKNEISHLNSTMKDMNDSLDRMVDVFTNCEKDNEKMKYNVSSVDGFIILYSEEYAFDKARAEKEAPDKLKVFAMTPEGRIITECESIEELESTVRFGNKLTKEFLKENTTPEYADIREWGRPSLRETALAVVKSFKDTLFRTQQEKNREQEQKLSDIEAKAEEFHGNVEQLTAEAGKKISEGILHSHFDRWISLNHFRFDQRNPYSISNSTLRCKIAGTEKGDFKGGTLSFHLGEQTLIDEVSFADKNGSLTKIYTLDDKGRVTINEGFLNDNPYLKQVFESTPFYHEQVKGDLADRYIAGQTVATLTDEGRIAKPAETPILRETEERLYQAVIRDTAELGYQSFQFDNCVAYRNEDGEMLVAEADKDGNVSMQAVDRYGTVSDSYKTAGGEKKTVPPAMEKKFTGVADRVKSAVEKEKARMDKEAKMEKTEPEKTAVER